MAVVYTTLFGRPDRPWHEDDWVASDDSVRGGSSHSTLTVTQLSLKPDGKPLGGGIVDGKHNVDAEHNDNNNSHVEAAVFSGHLDTSTLGGAGFASQRTVDGFAGFDLSGQDALALELPNDGTKSTFTYTLILKNEVLPPREDGREQSSVSYECGFTEEDGEVVDGGARRRVVLRLADFKATYRGRELEGAKPLDKKHVKRVQIMCRSFFDKQSGDFSLTIISVTARRDAKLGSGAEETRAQRWLPPCAVS